jgi:hypothetical protein
MTRYMRWWPVRALVLSLGLPLVLIACSDSAEAPRVGQSPSPSASVQSSDNLSTDFVAVGGGGIRPMCWQRFTDNHLGER